MVLGKFEAFSHVAGGGREGWNLSWVGEQRAWALKTSSPFILFYVTPFAPEALSVCLSVRFHHLCLSVWLWFKLLYVFYHLRHSVCVSLKIFLFLLFWSVRLSQFSSFDPLISSSLSISFHQSVKRFINMYLPLESRLNDDVRVIHPVGVSVCLSAFLYMNALDWLYISTHSSSSVSFSF